MTTSSEALILSLQETLTEVRRIEDSMPNLVKFEFGNLKDAEHGSTPRIVWIHEGGIALEKQDLPVVEGEPVPLGQRRARYRARLRFRTKEECETALDQLARAARLLAVPDRIALEAAPYEFPTQTDGKLSEGFQLLDLVVGVRTSIARDPIGSTELVEVQSSQFRAGIENPEGEPVEDTEWEVNRWSG